MEDIGQILALDPPGGAHLDAGHVGKSTLAQALIFPQLLDAGSLHLQIHAVSTHPFVNRLGVRRFVLAAPSLVAAAWGIGVGLSASFASATAARVGGFPFLTVLVIVANEYTAIYARVGTQALEAGVVRLYSVVLILGGWVRVRCARLCGVHGG